MNKITVDNLINNMVQVIITEVDTSLNHSNLIVRVKTDSMTSSLIAKSIARYGLDWSSDIIRDEVIATLYESMLTVSEGVEPEEIHFNNSAYMGKVYSLVEGRLKDKLIPASRKNRAGEITGFTEEYVSPIAEDEETTSKLEQLLNGQMEKMMMIGGEDKMNQFLKWFNSNKKNILTKKQLQFLDNELLDMDKRRMSEMRKRIAERVTKAYELKYGSVTPRIAVLMDQQETIETILEAKDFKAALLPHMEETFIIDTIIDNVSPEAAKAFNTGSTEVWVIKEYRIALFKALGRIIDILEKEGK